jgi:hypothetical protein
MELLTNYPIKKEWIQWALQEWKKFYSTCRTSEEFLEKAKLEVTQIGGKFLHMGKKTFEKPEKAKTTRGITCSIMDLKIWDA